MKGEHLTELEQEVARRYAEGQLAREVGAGLGLSTSQIYRILCSAGVGRRSRGRVKRPREHLTEREQEAVRRYTQGLAAREVAASLDLSIQQVYEVLRFAGVNRRPPGSHPTRSRDKQVARLYVEEGLSLEEAGARFGLTPERVRQILERAGVRRRDGGASLSPEEEVQRDQEIVRLYVEEGLSLEKAGARLGLTSERVRQKLERRGVSPRNGSCRLTHEQQARRDQEIVRLYVEEGLSLKKIGARFGLSDFAVRHILERAGVTRRAGGLCHLLRDQQMHRNREIVRLYVEESLTGKELGARFGLSETGISYTLRRAGVHRRSPSSD